MNLFNILRILRVLPYLQPGSGYNVHIEKKFPGSQAFRWGLSLFFKEEKAWYRKIKFFLFKIIFPMILSW